MTGRAPLIAFQLPAPEAAEAFRAAWDAGHAVLPLDLRAPATEVAGVLDSLQPTDVVDGFGRRPLPGGEPVDAGVAAVVATSGTTAAPRGVELTWDGLRASAAAVSAAVDAGPTDRWLACLPLHHVGGLGVVGRAWANGQPVTVIEGLGGDADPGDEAFVSLVPTQLARLLDANADLRRFRRVLVGGGPLAPSLRRRAEAAGVHLVSTYGLTETWGGVVHDGRPLSGAEVRLDPADGEIYIRGEMVMRGYRLLPKDTAAAFAPDGWLRTGDVGAFDAGGRLLVVDRKRDLVITGGVNVSPTEVEAVLTEHPGVADVCVAGAPDHEWGERVVAYVVPRDPAAPPDLVGLQELARRRLAGPKLPRQLVLVEDIPRSPGGKPLRRLLPRPG